MAIDGDRVVVGTPNQRRATGENPGGVYVFDATTAERLQLIWGDEIGLDQIARSNLLGADMAMSGLTVVVGRQNADMVHVLDVSGTPPPQTISTEVPIKRTPGLVQPGDAERDLDFDQFDVIQVLSAGNYKTGEPTTWGEGDWNGGPGSPDFPPVGDGQFDQFDLVAANIAGFYRTGPYDDGGVGGSDSVPVECCGVLGDERTSIVYDPKSGDLSVDAPSNQQLTSINIDSVAGIFTGEAIPFETLGGVFDIDDDQTIFKAQFTGSFGSISFGTIAEPSLSSSFLLSDLAALGSLAGGGSLGVVDLVYLGETATPLMPGDANQNLEFDQLDLVQVLAVGKYRSGLPATWGEGDWDGAPGGSVGNPPAGDGLFNQLDIVAALAGSVFLSGPYASITSEGSAGDEQTSLVYHAATGELAVEAPVSKNLTSINIVSAGNLFTGDRPPVLDGAFDNFDTSNVFKATFGGNFGDLDLGIVLPGGLDQAVLLADLSVVGSLSGGGDLGDVDLIYVPVPVPPGLFLISVPILVASLFQKRQ